jgi:hypothetical protein
MPQDEHLAEKDGPVRPQPVFKIWLNGSAPDCKSVVLGSNSAPPQHMANSVNPEVGSHLGLHSIVCWPLRGGRGTQYTQKTLKIYRKKKFSKSSMCHHPADGMVV